VAPNIQPAVAHPRSPRERITELDGLRGVLAWTVVLSHILFVSGVFPEIVRRVPPFQDLAESAVDVFMLLSGFAITHVLMLRPPVSRYFVRRALRIVPAYYVALLAGIFLSGLLADNLGRLPAGAIAPGYLQICAIGGERLWLDAPLHFLFLHGAFPAATLPALPYTLLGVAWSLSLEVQFYLIAPALFAFCRRGWPARAALIILVASGTLFAGKIIDVFSNAFFPAKAAYFLVGGLSFFAVTRPAQPWRAWLAVLAPSFILALLWWRGTGRLNEALLAPIVWCAVLVAVRFDHFRLLRAGLNSRPLQLLGRISYSTYLFHAPVIILLQAAIWRWVNPPSSSSLLLWTATAAIPCTFFISWMCWRGIELPFQRLGRARREAVT
jgi:peptidoglycan/LPS O-acetylase OafA/YrhL